MPTRNRLDVSASMTVAADGTATTLPVGPAKYGDQWHVTLMSMQSTDVIGTAQMFAFRGPAAASNQIDYTRKVTGDTSNCDFSLVNGEFLTFTVTGGTTGAVYTIHVTGELYGVR